MNRKDRRAALSQERTHDEPGTPAAVDKLFAAALRLHHAGQLNEAAGSYRQVLALDPPHDKSLQNLGAIAIKAGRNELAVDLFRRAIALNDAAPDYHRNIAVAFHGLGQWDQAIVHARRAVALKADGVDAYVILGDALEQQHQLSEALTCFTQAAMLEPGNATAHTHLGGLQMRLGRPAEAKASLERAIDLDPNQAGAHFFLGNARFEEGQPQAAIECYLRAIAITPDHLNCHTNICSALMAQSKYAEAIAHYQQILEYKPDFVAGHCYLAVAYLASGEPGLALGSVRRALKLAETTHAKTLFVACLQRLPTVDNDGEMSDLLVRALSEPWDRPNKLVAYGLKLVKADAGIAGCIARVAASWPLRLNADGVYGTIGLGALSGHAPLRAMLENALVADIAMEQLLTNVRRCLLDAATVASTDAAPDENTVAFHASLARQCFITEYAYALTDEELAEVGRLRLALHEALRAGERIPADWLLALACYGSLHTLPHCERLLSLTWPTAVDALLTQQVREPLEEIRLRNTIPPLTPIENEVSKVVRDQYEENPYPRWVKAPVASVSQRPDLFLRELFPLAKFRSLSKAGTIDLLNAGCGTGQQLLDLAQIFEGSQVLAIDLSLASLSYAKRKAMERGLGNIEFGQADIMQLGTLGRQFDIIESCGVLHHLGDPDAGWRVLVPLLRPNGFMRIALYSELARQQIVAVQKLIARQGYGRSASEIRRFRQEFLVHPDPALVGALSAMNDFYTLSECRDLLFHVQEHRFTIPRIKAFLAANDLEFIGFEVQQPIRHLYARQFPADAAMSNLDHWHAFEQANPSTFLGMYSFWVQKGVAEQAN
ncbi:MAG: hypothetical protein JWN71_2395 [Xanthobacteraceae bacterium]|nr:hypothetical protein [Xanthobacteraceae bacterium]